MLKVLSPCLLFLFNFSLNAQIFVDMTDELSNVSQKLIIDGNAIRSEYGVRDEIIITGKNMFFSGKTNLILNDVVVQLSGDIIVRDGVKVYPKFLNSYIVCKSSESWESKNIIVKSSVTKVDLSKVKHIKKIKGNPRITIYDYSGHKVYDGTKADTKGKMIVLGRYDLRVKGQSYLSKLLFY